MNGVDCFFDGFRLIRKAGLIKFFIMPTIVNVVVLLTLFFVASSYLDSWVDVVMSWFPDWMSLFYWLVWLIALMVVLALIIICFTFIANIVSSPFNALLAAKVESYLTDSAPVSDVSLWLILPRAFWREVSKLFYVLPRLALLLVITTVPLVNFLSPALWFLFGAWMMAIQYADYGADNNDVSFAKLKVTLQENRLQAMLFGLPVYLLLTIPGINLVVMPVGVAGGTRFWVEHLKR